MAINREARRTKYVAASPADRAYIRQVITDGLAAVNEEARPELAADFRDTLAIFDEVDAEVPSDA